MKNSLTSHKQRMNKLCMNNKSQTMCEPVVHEQVRHKQVVNKSLTTHEQLMNKSQTKFEQVLH